MATPNGEPGTALAPGQWVDRHGDKLYSYALSRLRDADAVEEVVQETLMSAWRARSRYAGKGTESGKKVSGL